MTISAWVIPGLKYKIDAYQSPQVKAERIIEFILDYRSMELSEIITASRHTDFVYTRYLIFYFLRKKTKLTLGKIGEMLSPKTKPYKHETVIRGLKRLNYLIETEQWVKKDIETINISL